jgi:transcriptional regulator of nitric oxide reductase
MGIVKTSQDIRSICLRDEAWTHLVSLVASGMHNYLMAQFPWDPVR